MVRVTMFCADREREYPSSDNPQTIIRIISRTSKRLPFQMPLAPQHQAIPR